MSQFQSQRTYAIIGTGGCGKTTLAELLLLEAGAITRLGKIEEGTTALDYEPEEIKRRGSIQPGFATFEHNSFQHFFADLPGDGNFLGDSPILLAGMDAVLFTIDAVDGVRPLTKRHWASVREAELPAICVVTKLDRDRSNFEAAFAGLQTLPGAKPVLLYAPIGEHDAFKGVVDVLAGTAIYFDGSTADIPADMADDIQLTREYTIENIAESDDVLMERYLEEGSLTSEELEQGLQVGVRKGTLLPVIAVSGLEGFGGKEVLSAIEKYLPSGLEHEPFMGKDDQLLEPKADGPLTLLIIKTLADAFAGQINVARILSGTVNGDATLTNMTTGETERLGTPMLISGKNQVQTKDAFGPGALIGLAKLKDTHTGDTLADAKSPFQFALPALPGQLISYALAPEQKGDEDKVYAAVQKLLDEDITLKLARNEETGDILLSGMGQLHIETAVERAKRRSKIEIVLKTPQVPYRETFKGSSSVQGRHKKQSGGRGQFGDCFVEFSHQTRGDGYAFEDAIVGGAIPRQYIPAVDKGIQEAAMRGSIAGYPVVDFKARLYDGSYHNVDSSEMAFKIAGSIAFKKALEELKPVLLEPIVSMSIFIPDESMGDVIGDLSSRRGRVSGSDSEDGVTEIRAFVPMNEVLRYAPDLRSMTSGQGSFTMEFDHYEEAPQPIMEKVIAEAAAAAEEK